MLRIALIVVLSLIVPLQGAAAVAAAQCMAMGHHQSDGADPGHAHDGDGVEQHAATHDHGDGSENSHCGPCIGCCASASIAGAASLPVLAAPANPKYVLSPLPPRVVQPLGFDRPPLSL